MFFLLPETLAFLKPTFPFNNSLTTRITGTTIAAGETAASDFVSGGGFSNVFGKLSPPLPHPHQHPHHTNPPRSPPILPILRGSNLLRQLHTHLHLNPIQQQPNSPRLPGHQRQWNQLRRRHRRRSIPRRRHFSFQSRRRRYH